MPLLIPFLPFIGFISAALLGRFIGSYGAVIITTSLLFSSFILSAILAFQTAFTHNFLFIDLLTWIDVAFTQINFGFQYDSLTACMLLVITSISFTVHLYSSEYMSNDPHLPRFMSYLSLFTFFMLILVSSDNLVQLFIGWEGVGVCSYLLINFWFTRIDANKSAILAMVMNRIGDLAFLIAIMIIQDQFKTLDFSSLFPIIEFLNNSNLYTLFPSFSYNTFELISLMIFLGAVGKSAQLGLHTWLPSAMEGPTPVSALIHAATMVTAGVFLVIRTSSIFELSPNTLAFVTIIGATTAFFAGTVGLVQNDLKRVIAYSTCSQLGFMVFICGLSQYQLAMFHLANHAFFKALLFLGAGSVIHGLGDEQDFRRLGGTITKLPFTYSMITIGSLALTGFPFLTGFYSKDAILEIAYSSYSVSATFAFWMGTLATFTTAFYSWRLISLTFLIEPLSSHNNFIHAHEPSWKMTLPLFILSIGSIFLGYTTQDIFIGLGSDFFNTVITVTPNHLMILDSEFLPTFFWPLVMSALGSITALIMYSKLTFLLFLSSFTSPVKNIYTFLNKRWYFDQIYSRIAYTFLSFGHSVSYKAIDRGLLEWWGPSWLTNQLPNTSGIFSSLQSGQIYNYAFLMFISTTIIIAITILNIESSITTLLILFTISSFISKPK